MWPLAVVPHVAGATHAFVARLQVVAGTPVEAGLPCTLVHVLARVSDLDPAWTTASGNKSLYDQKNSAQDLSGNYFGKILVT